MDRRPNHILNDDEKIIKKNLKKLLKQQNRQRRYEVRIQQAIYRKESNINTIQSYQNEYIDFLNRTNSNTNTNTNGSSSSSSSQQEDQQQQQQQQSCDDDNTTSTMNHVPFTQVALFSSTSVPQQLQVPIRIKQPVAPPPFFQWTIFHNQNISHEEQYARDHIQRIYYTFHQRYVEPIIIREQKQEQQLQQAQQIEQQQQQHDNHVDNDVNNHNIVVNGLASVQLVENDTQQQQDCNNINEPETTNTNTKKKKKKINSQKMIQLYHSHSRTLCQHMTKGSQTSTMFTNQYALIGYTRTKFVERAILITQTLFRIIHYDQYEKDKQKQKEQQMKQQQQQIENEMNHQYDKDHDDKELVLLTLLERIVHQLKHHVHVVCSIGCGPGCDGTGVYTFYHALQRKQEQQQKEQEQQQKEKQDHQQEQEQEISHDNIKKTKTFPITDMIFMDYTMSQWQPIVQCVGDILLEEEPYGNITNSNTTTTTNQQYQQVEQVLKQGDDCNPIRIHFVPGDIRKPIWVQKRSLLSPTYSQIIHNNCLTEQQQQQIPEPSNLDQDNDNDDTNAEFRRIILKQNNDNNHMIHSISTTNHHHGNGRGTTTTKTTTTTTTTSNTAEITTSTTTIDESIEKSKTNIIDLIVVSYLLSETRDKWQVFFDDLILGKQQSQTNTKTTTTTTTNVTFNKEDDGFCKDKNGDVDINEDKNATTETVPDDTLQKDEMEDSTTTTNTRTSLQQQQHQQSFPPECRRHDDDEHHDHDTIVDRWNCGSCCCLAVRSGTIFIFTDPTAWQLHIFKERYHTVLDFIWLDSSMYRMELQILEGRVGPAVLLGIMK